MILGRNVRVIGSFVTLLLAFGVFGSNPLHAQEAAAAPKPAAPPYGGKYEVLPVMEILLQDTIEGKRAQRNGETKMAAILRGSEPLVPNAQAVDIYYGQYFFSRLTHPQYLGEWPESRQKFIQQQLGIRTVPPDVHKYLVDLARRVMTTIIRGNYHPVAQSNAMLLLASLNADEAVLVGDARKPPVPLTAALGVMFQELDRPEQKDAVRAAALAGILRHVRVDSQWPAASRQLSGSASSQKNRENLIVAAMLKWVNAKEPPEGRSRGGHDWLRRRAIEILGILGSSGPGNNVVPALETLLADSDEALSIRCAAGEALGHLNLPQGVPIDAKEVARKIATAAVFACRKEILRVETQLEKEKEAKASAASSPYGGGYGGYGDMGGYGSEMEGYGSEMEGYGSEMEGYGSEMGGYGSEMGGYGSEMGGYGSEMGGYGSEMGGYGYGTTTTAKKFNPLGYRVVMTRRRIKSQLLQLKEGLGGPGAEGAPATGVFARATPGEQQDYVNKAIKGIDDIIAVIDANEETEMEPMIEKISGSVQLLENNCEVVVTLPGEEGESMLDEGLLNPLGLPDGVSGPDDAPMVPPGAAPEDPVGTPAAAAPTGEEPGLGQPPSGGPPAGGAPAGAPAAEPALGQPPAGGPPAGGAPAGAPAAEPALGQPPAGGPPAGGGQQTP